MLGRDLVSVLNQRHQAIPLARAQADITNADKVVQAFEEHKPDAVIHAAAFTAVDECEIRPEVAFQINAGGTRNVSFTCSRLRIPLLYVSTDYVFDGEKESPYLEEDATRPLNVYGQSKLEGEQSVRELVERWWIVRTSWLFGPWGKNFVGAILDKAAHEGSLRVVDDQVGAPTYTLDLAGKLMEIVERGTPGAYHVTNAGCCSWFEFACEILRQAGLNQAQVSPIPTSAAGRRAVRPKNSRLANRRLKAEGLGLLPAWQDALSRYLARQAGLKGRG